MSERIETTVVKQFNILLVHVTFAFERNFLEVDRHD